MSTGVFSTLCCGCGVGCLWAKRCNLARFGFLMIRVSVSQSIIALRDLSHVLLISTMSNALASGNTAQRTGVFMHPVCNCTVVVPMTLLFVPSASVTCADLTVFILTLMLLSMQCWCDTYAVYPAAPESANAVAVQPLMATLNIILGSLLCTAAVTGVLHLGFRV